MQRSPADLNAFVIDSIGVGHPDLKEIGEIFAHSRRIQGQRIRGHNIERPHAWL